MNTTQAVQTSLVMLTLAHAGACTGVIDGTGGGVARPDHPPGALPARPPQPDPASGMMPGQTAIPAGPVPDCGAVPPWGPRRLVRLTPRQYGNTVAVLFAGRTSDTRREVAAPRGLEVPLQPADLEHYSTYAGSQSLNDFEVRQSLQQLPGLAAALVASLRAKPGSCLAAGTKVAVADCAATIAADRGRVLFRRPVTPEETAHYRGVFTAVAAQGENEALALMVQAMMMAPQALFVVEQGTEAALGGATRLGGFEIAAALAYTLTDYPPDEELWAAASKNELSAPEQIRSHVARLLQALDTREPARRFLREYFEYERVLSVFKTVSGYSREGLFADANAHVAELLKVSGRRDFVKTVFGSPVAVVTSATAPFYGVPAPPRGDVRKVDLPPTERAGFLTQPAFLAAFSEAELTSPVKRGRFLSEKVLCRPVPDLPIGQVPPLPAATGDTPMRARLAAHTREPACAACHKLMDPLGLALEMYDHTGKLRIKPVDSSGILTDSGNQDGPFNNAVELSARLASSSAVLGCFTQNSLQYWLGRPSRAEDRCTVAAAQAAYVTTGGDYVALVQALFTSTSFLNRRGE